MNKKNRHELVVKVFSYVISAMRAKASSNEYRNEKLKQRRKYYFFFKLKFIGFLFFCLDGVVRSSSISKFKKGIIDDHASGVIRDVFTRNADISFEKEIKTVKINILYSLIGFVSLIPSVLYAYIKTKPEDLIEFTRCANISISLIHYYYPIKKIKPKYILIADTTDPKRMALGIMSEINGIPLYVFSVVRHGIRKYHPFLVNTYFCWTKEQEMYLRSNTQSNVIVMNAPIKAIKMLTVNYTSLKYGLLLNAKYRQSEVEKFLYEIDKKFGLKDIQIRPHPSKHAKEINFKNGKVRDSKEPLNEYLNSVDCVFAPNTNSMLEALLAGVPVIYVHFLGEGDYDMQGLVAKGLVIPYDSILKLPESVNEFYCEKNYKSSIEYLRKNYCGSNTAENDCINLILDN